MTDSLLPLLAHLPVTADITFQWPRLLWLLLLLPVAALYPLVLARRRRAADAALAHFEASGTAPGTGFLARAGGLVPPVLMLVALALLLLAVSRPQASLVLPARARTVMLAMDVSGSMRASDIRPDRITAARSAVKAFVEAQPADARVGLVSIAATASVVQSPTDKRGDLLEAVDRFQLQRGTALGSGLVLSLATLLPEAGIDVERQINGTSSRWRFPNEDAPKPVLPGSNGKVAIVLVSDGQSNTGPDPLKMAQLAADHGVRIYTVGIGTPEGATLSMKGMSMRVRLDEATLRRIAELTQGEYYPAASAAGLADVYRRLAAQISMEKKRPVEVSAVLVGIAALLASLAAFTTLWRDGRIA